MIKMKDESYIDENHWMNPLPNIESLKKHHNLPFLDNKRKKELRNIIRSFQQLTYEGYSHPTRLSDWYENVKDRDNYECQICGNEDNIQAHHIIYRSVMPKLQYNLNNGITLCRECHSDTHRLEHVYRLILFPKGRPLK